MVQYIISKIISLAKELRHNSIILKTLTSVSETKRYASLYQTYTFFLLYEKGQGDCYDVILILLIGEILVNNFIITHTLASTEDQTNIDSVVHTILVNSYKNIFSSRYYFICNNCGYKSNELNWMCPSCNTWETINAKING